MTESLIDTLIDTYCLAWSEQDAGARDALLSEVLCDGASYTDPGVATVGIQALSAHISRVQHAMPGAKVVRTSQIDQHHGLARFSWHIESDGKSLFEGSIDVVEIDQTSGRLLSIRGFFGPSLPL